MTKNNKKDVKLSATRISTFLQCKLKYWYGYVEKLPKVPNIVFRLGIAVHESLEYAGKIWLEKENREGFTKTEVEAILDKYNEVSVREGITDLDVHKEGRDLVKARLKNFISGKKLLALEQTFGFKDDVFYTEDGVPLIGAIDKAEEIDENTLLIVDYKTSKTIPDMHQLRNDIQLSIYDLVARTLWPEYGRIILSLDLLRTDMVYTYRTDEERAEFSKYLLEIYKQMVDMKKSDAKAQMNIFCPWCDYKEYCEEYKKACERTDYKFDTISNIEEKDLVEQWLNARNTKKLLEMRERELGMLIMEKIKSGKTIANDDQEICVRQNSRKTYDLKTIHETVPAEDFPKLVNVNMKAVDKYIEDNPTVKSRILEAMTSNFTSPFLVTKKLKNYEGEINEQED